MPMRICEYAAGAWTNATPCCSFQLFGYDFLVTDEKKVSTTTSRCIDSLDACADCVGDAGAVAGGQQ